MNKKLIMKFDIKDEMLRLDMYQVESIRVKGRCKARIKSGDMSSGYIHHILNELLLQINKEFDVGFKKNSINTIRTWIKANIFKIYLREDIPIDIKTMIIGLVKDGTIIVQD